MKIELYEKVEVTLGGMFFGIQGTITKHFNDDECLVDTNYPNSPNAFRCSYRNLKEIENFRA